MQTLYVLIHICFRFFYVLKLIIGVLCAIKKQRSTELVAYLKSNLPKDYMMMALLPHGKSVIDFEFCIGRCKNMFFVNCLKYF